MLVTNFWIINKIFKSLHRERMIITFSIPNPFVVALVELKISQIPIQNRELIFLSPLSNLPWLFPISPWPKSILKLIIPISKQFLFSSKAYRFKHKSFKNHVTTPSILPKEGFASNTNNHFKQVINRNTLRFKFHINSRDTQSHSFYWHLSHWFPINYQ